MSYPPGTLFLSYLYHHIMQCRFGSSELSCRQREVSRGVFAAAAAHRGMPSVGNAFCRVPYNERGACFRNRQSKKGMKGEILLKIKQEGGSIGVGTKKCWRIIIGVEFAPV